MKGQRGLGPRSDLLAFNSTFTHQLQRPRRTAKRGNEKIVIVTERKFVERKKDQMSKRDGSRIPGRRSFASQRGQERGEGGGAEADEGGRCAGWRAVHRVCIQRQVTQRVASETGFVGDGEIGGEKGPYIPQNQRKAGDATGDKGNPDDVN